MPLLITNLVNAITKIFLQDGQTVQSSAKNIAQAYAGYASVAQGPNVDPVILTGSEQLILEQYLIRAFSQYNQNVTSNLVGQGITNFWLAPPVLTSTGGICSAIITAGGQSLLLSSQAKTRQQGAQNFANALHTMTQTVIFTEVPPLVSGPIV
jgi:hypothetical protein